MPNRMHLRGSLAGIFLMLLPLTGMTMNSQDFGEYVVHFNALVTNTLPPAVTKQYGIKRSQNRGLLNITVLKETLGMMGEPIPAKVTASAVNLTGQLKNLSLREIREGNAIYYIAEFPVANEETMDFDIHVQPDGNAGTLDVRFRRQFYTR